MSTATILKQPSRGGQRVGNPSTAFGGSPLAAFTAPRVQWCRDPKHRPLSNTLSPVGRRRGGPRPAENIARFNTARSPAAVRGVGDGRVRSGIQDGDAPCLVLLDAQRIPTGMVPEWNIALFVFRVAFPTLRPPRLLAAWGPAPWMKRGKRAAAVTLIRGEVGHADLGGERRALGEHRPFHLPRRLAENRVLLLTYTVVRRTLFTV